MSTNDNNTPDRSAINSMPDAHGHAALLLVESLIHGLVERSVIKVDDAVEIVESADSIQVEVAEAADGYGAPMWRSHALLSAIAQSLRHDSGGSPPSITPVR